MTQTHQQHRPPIFADRENYSSVTDATYTAKGGDRVIGVNRAGAVTVTLPSAEVRPGRTYTIKDESGAAASNNITIATEGSETIDGSATDVISDNYGAKLYYSDGSNWFEVPLVTPQLHQLSHNSGGSDAMKLDDLGAPDDNTDLDFSTSLHGLAPKGTNAGNFLKDDGSWADPGVTDHQLIRKASDEDVTSSTTMQNDDDFVFAIAANEVWMVTLFLFLEGTTTGGLKGQWSVPSGATGGWWNFAVGTSTIVNNFQRAALTALNIVDNTVVKDMAICHTVIANSSNAGNVQFQWAQAVTHATATTIGANSVLIAHKIG
jgi:hypothetical protein